MEIEGDNLNDTIKTGISIHTDIKMDSNMDSVVEAMVVNNCNSSTLDVIDETSKESSKLSDPGIIIMNDNDENETMQEDIEMTPTVALETINKKNVELIETVVIRTMEGELKNIDVEISEIVESRKLENTGMTSTVALEDINEKNVELIEAVVMKTMEGELKTGDVEISEIDKSRKSDISEIKINHSEVLPSTSLGIIATAYCDTDTDDEVEILDKECQSVKDKIWIKNDGNTNYRVEDSSDEEESEDSSSSSSSSSYSSVSTSSSDESEDELNSEGHEKRRNKITQIQKNKERGEYDALPPIEDLKISMPEVLCEPLGTVGWMVDQLVVVIPKPNTPTLNIDTVLFVDRGQRVLGRIFDVFGQVAEPHYCVRFNDTEHIKENNIKVGMTVYYGPNTPYTSLVFMSELLRLKACDDVGEDEHPEFSDDEQERAYFATLKQKPNKPRNGAKPSQSEHGEIPNKRYKTSSKTGWRSQHPWNSNRKNSFQNTARAREPSQHLQYQPPSWRPPVDYFGRTPEFAYQDWPRHFGRHQQLHSSPQLFHNTSNSTQPLRNGNLWNIPPPPPPPPGF